MTPYVADPDFQLFVGDALETLRELPDRSVDCCVTSPPYWGLRDYGVPGQLGLEATPDEYVAAMVAVFAEVRRVLADAGTLWLNLGDSYADGGNGARDPERWPKQSRNANGFRSMHAKKGHSVKPKDLVGIPWAVAFALRADGWYLRSDIIWSKPNPMPESVTDRPTKAHEYVFLLSKQPRYWFDAEAVREPFLASTIERGYSRSYIENTPNKMHTAPEEVRAKGNWRANAYDPTAALKRPQDETLDGSEGEAPRGPDGRRATHVQAANGSIQHRDGERWPNAGRNVRSVWEIATQPYPDAHFATFPEELVRRCILAGCPEWVCATCGKARERLTDVTYANPGNRSTNGPRSLAQRHEAPGFGQRLEKRTETVGWSDCGHNEYRPGVVLDPFGGSGTTALVARKHGRRSILIELNETYAAMAARRLGQLSLLADGAA